MTQTIVAFLLAGLFSLAMSLGAQAQIDRAVEAHGGLAKWQSFASVEYDLTYERPNDQLEQHAIIFEEWQEADGLTVPKSAAYFEWKNETIEGEALGRLRFGNVQFSATAPEASKFAKAADGVVAPLKWQKS